MARGKVASRAVCWLMLAAYGLVVSGVPLPIARWPAAAGSTVAKQLAGKDRSRPFPCMDKPCGCATAEQCFSACCCNSPAELLAWAEANRVDPSTLFVLQRRVATTVAEPPAASCCCSSAAAEPSCCSAPAAPAAPLAQADMADATVADEPTTAPGMIPHHLSLKAMLACGGILAGWSAAMTSLPPPSGIRCEHALPLVAVIVVADEIGRSVDQPTEAPPPRA